MEVNELELNLDKAEVFLLQKSTTQVLDYQPLLNGVAFPLQDWGAVAISDSVGLGHSSPCLDALVTSWLDYCNTLLSVLPWNTVQKL